MRYGEFITAAVNFLIIGTALFFIVRAVQQIFRREEDKKPTELDLLTDIRRESRRR